MPDSNTLVLISSAAPSNKRLERTRHERASLLSNLGEPLKRSVRRGIECQLDDDQRLMRTHKISRILLVTTFALATTFLLSSCAPITKGDVYQEVSKGIDIGADKTEVIAYLESLKVKGDKPIIEQYKRDTSGHLVYAGDGKAVLAEGFIAAKFESVSGVFIFCHTVWVVFYFDKSDKLITYIIDC